MKRRKVTSRPLSLGDLILAVSSYSDTQEETVATVADLLASGQASIMNKGRKIRARVR
jgi:S-adenosylmethionine:tRNA-ribosyltransferase-isomerase (queuine synthetase)